MSVTLAKGERLDVGGGRSAMSGHLRAELVWNDRFAARGGVDLDVSAIVLGSKGRALSDAHFVYYNNPLSPDGAVHHLGDEVVGGTDDREVVELRLDRASASVDSIVFVASVHDPEASAHNFGQVVDAVIRLVDAERDVEIARFELSEDASTSTTVVFGELVRSANGWTFEALERPSAGLAGVLSTYAVNIA